MKQVEKARIWLYGIVVVGLAVIVFIWSCILTAVTWAGWGGFGDISMEYTADGARIVGIIVFVPVVLLIFLIFMRLVRNIIKKEPKTRYAKDLLVLVVAVGIGILAFVIFRSARQTIVDALKYNIVQSGWMQYPVP